MGMPRLTSIRTTALAARIRFGKETVPSYEAHYQALQAATREHGAIDQLRAASGNIGPGGWDTPPIAWTLHQACAADRDSPVGAAIESALALADASVDPEHPRRKKHTQRFLNSIRL